MIGILIVTHGNLSQEFVNLAKYMMHCIDQIEAISILETDSSGKVRNDMKEAIDRLDSGAGVMILTDMCGGTPSNMALSFRGENVALVWGINFGMLKSLIWHRENHKLEELIKIICDDGRRDIGGWDRLSGSFV